MADRAVFEFLLTDNTKPQAAPTPSPQGGGAAPSATSPPIAPNLAPPKPTGAPPVPPPFTTTPLAPPPGPSPAQLQQLQQQQAQQLQNARAQQQAQQHHRQRRRRQVARIRRGRARQARMLAKIPKATLAPIPKAQLVKQPQGGSIPGLPGLAGQLGLPGGMGAALGSVAGPLAIAKLIESKVKEAIAKPAELAEVGADSAGRLAKNQLSGLTKPLEELPGLFGDVAKSANRVGKAFDDAADAFLKRAREIGGYNGQLAVSNAMADVSRMRTDMREAQVMGPELARLVDARSSLDATIAEALLPIKKVVVEILGNAAENLTAFVEFVKPFIEANAEILRMIMGIIGDAKGVLADILEKLSNAPFLGDLKDIAQMLRGNAGKLNRQPVIDAAMIRSNERMAEFLDDIRQEMDQGPPLFGVPRLF